jgi:hypothetical protein
MVLSDDKKSPLRRCQQGPSPIVKSREIEVPVFRFPCHCGAKADEDIGIL